MPEYESLQNRQRVRVDGGVSAGLCGHKRFVSCEGIDGAGKSSHIEWLAELLRADGRTVICTREPGGTPLGETLRGLLLTEPMHIDTELLLMSAARRQHLVDVIEPALVSGHTVLSDRFHDSTYAFQGGGRGVSMEKIDQLDTWVGGRRPDLTLYFDLPVEVAMARIAGSRLLDRFESERRDFHVRVRAAYLARAGQHPTRIVVIDANRSIEDIRQSIRVALTR